MSPLGSRIPCDMEAPARANREQTVVNRQVGTDGIDRTGRELARNRAEEKDFRILLTAGKRSVRLPVSHLAEIASGEHKGEYKSFGGQRPHSPAEVGTPLAECSPCPPAGPA
jgi:hypothetical protein